MATQTPAATGALDWSARPRRMRWPRRMVRLIRQHPLGLFGFVIIVGFVFLGVFGPLVAPYEPRELRAGPPLAGPSLAHPFGTNTLGQDVLSRVIAGARISLIIGSASVFLGAGMGAFLGMMAGYYGRWVDYLLQRSSEAFAAFPSLVLYFLLIAAFGQSPKTLVFAIGIGALFGANRVIRAATMVEARSTYVEAARSIGCSETRIFLRHVVVNVLPLAVVFMSGALGAAILAESTLAFIGLGVEPGTPSWGIDMSGQNLSIARTGYWHIVIFPGIAISLVVLGANLLGDSLRDIWDPRLRR